MSGALKINSHLRDRRISDDGRCRRCSDGDETIVHAIYECHHSREATWTLRNKTIFESNLSHKEILVSSFLKPDVDYRNHSVSVLGINPAAGCASALGWYPPPIA